MSVRIIALFIAALAGVTMALQGTMNSALGKKIGLLETVFVVNLVGLTLLALMLFVFRLGSGSISALSQVPWYLYLGGILGVIITYGVICSIPKVGVAPATTAIILGQVFTAGLIDSLGLFGMNKLPFNWCRVAGTLLMAGGAWLILRK